MKKKYRFFEVGDCHTFRQEPQKTLLRANLRNYHVVKKAIWIFHNKFPADGRTCLIDLCILNSERRALKIVTSWLPSSVLSWQTRCLRGNISAFVASPEVFLLSPCSEYLSCFPFFFFSNSFLTFSKCLALRIKELGTWLNRLSLRGTLLPRTTFRCVPCLRHKVITQNFDTF